MHVALALWLDKISLFAPGDSGRPRLCVPFFRIVSILNSWKTDSYCIPGHFGVCTIDRTLTQTTVFSNVRNYVVVLHAYTHGDLGLLPHSKDWCI